MTIHQLQDEQRRDGELLVSVDGEPPAPLQFDTFAVAAASKPPRTIGFIDGRPLAIGEPPKPGRWPLTRGDGWTWRSSRPN